MRFCGQTPIHSVPACIAHSRRQALTYGRGEGGRKAGRRASLQRHPEAPRFRAALAHRKGAEAVADKIRALADVAKDIRAAGKEERAA